MLINYYLYTAGIGLVSIIHSYWILYLRQKHSHTALKLKQSPRTHRKVWSITELLAIHFSFTLSVICNDWIPAAIFSPFKPYPFSFLFCITASQKPTWALGHWSYLRFTCTNLCAACWLCTFVLYIFICLSCKWEMGLSTTLYAMPSTIRPILSATVKIF